MIRCAYIKTAEIEAGTELGASLAVNLDRDDSKKAKRDRAAKTSQTGGTKGNKQGEAATDNQSQKHETVVKQPIDQSVGSVVETSVAAAVHAQESLESFMNDHGMIAYHSATVKLLTLLGKVRWSIHLTTDVKIL